MHRLDKDTSGVLLLARTRAAGPGALAEAFRHRDTRKMYWAAVAGVPHPRMGTIRYGLVKAPGARRRADAVRASLMRSSCDPGRQARHDRLRGSGQPRPARRMGGAGPDHRADAPAARAHGRDRASDCGGW